MKRHTGPESGSSSSPALPFAQQHPQSASPNLHPNSASPNSYIHSPLGSPSLHPLSTSPNSHSHSPKGTPSPIQPWLKRWSGLSSSQDNRQAPARPVSICVSHFDGSAAITPVSNRPSSSAIGPNKLVKRSFTTRDTPGDSKIPKPSLRKPSTSHQRSATLQERRTQNHNTVQDTPQSDLHTSPEVRWRSFFTPRISVEPPPSNKRQSPTSIPSPIQRVYPDRRYKPVLVSATEPVNRASVEHEEQQLSNVPVSFTPSPQQGTPRIDESAFEEPLNVLDLSTSTYAESPSQLEQLKNAAPRTRRSFTFGDLFSAEGRKRPTTRTSASVLGKTQDAPAILQAYSGEIGVASDSAQPAVVRDSVADAEHSNSEEVAILPDMSSNMHQAVEGASPGTVSPSKLDSISMPDHSDFLDLDSAKFGRTSPGRKGPPIDTIFQEPAPAQVHGSHILLKDILRSGTNHDTSHAARSRHSTILEEDDTATPPRSVRKPSTSPSPVSPPRQPRAPHLLAPNASDMPSLVQLRHKDKFDQDDDQESSWSFDADDDDGRSVATGRFAHLNIQGDFLNPSQLPDDFATGTPQRLAARQSDKDTRTSIFDWSEQPSLDRSPGQRSPPRPKTVHGKKDADSRGSRSVGRRASSGMHARSQSVPSAQESDGSRVQVVTNKFGTWGVGSKGVTEDWNEDFDFDDLQVTLPVLSPGGEKRLDSGIGMLVPQSIREQQTNVLANISLVRDWGLLIEEIKELKMKAITLDIFAPSNQAVWNEVEAMIDLADQESDEQTLAPRHSSPSSPSADSDVFDDSIVSTRRPSVQGSPLPRVRNAEGQSGPPLDVEQEIRIIPATPKRPRKNSEAVARAVIEAVQQNRRASDSGRARYEIPEKLHFDTATLRRIIPYVQDLRDRVKGIIREAEGLYASPPKLLDLVTIEKTGKTHPSSPSTQRNIRRSTPITEEASPGDDYHTSEDSAARQRTTTVS